MIKEANYKANNNFMQVAIDEARIGIFNGQGGPFGAVVVKDGKIIGKGHNMVLTNHDSTCHGEISAIRDAEKFLGTHDLSGCELYTTGEPCTMCLCACKWANLEKVYYGASIADNSVIGFRDSAFDNLFGGRINFKSYLVQIDRDACLKLFEEYNSIEHTNY